MKKTSLLSYQIFLRAEPEGGYTVTVPSLPGCVTYGESVEEAKKMATEAIELYIESLIDHNEPIPSDEAVFLATLNVKSPRTVSHHA